ncbi:Vacuolar protein sorting-associated protein 13 [Hypsizygus marmoreus]|uniref:Vacuolar protein sorting-associated protein 13 n=1 Tax=Hypsizygus marmoreus TaxID=39966 RepID=A0A369K7R2_HYPMA|nr:Vacuolar protein sorting-associated protein 13 [Hypsizygus marmoreus]
MWWLDPGKEVLNVLFNRILAPYVENLDLNQVNYGIGQGQLTLRNLRLKKGALDKFRLPVDVLEGHLGELSLSLHWLNLGNQPVEILIEDVYLLVVPSPQMNDDPEEEERRAQAAKAERLENAELLHMRGQAETSGETPQAQGLWESLITKVINNLQVTVKNIHVRYEDNLSVPGHPFAAGVTLAGFAAVSVNEEWEPAFIESTAGAIHKLANLQSLAVYFDTDSSSMAGLPPVEAKKKFFDMISHGQDTGHQFILKPVSGEGRIIVNHKVDQKTPRFDVQLIFDEIGVALDDNQYRDIISLFDMYHVYVRQRQYRRFRPQEVSITAARSRLLFAGNAILEGVRERNRKWTWAYFAERRDDRNRYVDLFEKKVMNLLAGTELKDIEDLEKKLSYEDIRFYRSIARSRLRKDQALRKKLEAERKPEPSKQGWTSWIWGSSSSASPTEEAGFGKPMTDEQRKELYEVLDYDEKTALVESFQTPRDSLKARVAAKLNKGSFALRIDPHGKSQEVISIVFDVFQANILQRPDNFEASVSLGGFGVFDGTTKGSLYPQIVRVKDQEPKTPSVRIPEAEASQTEDDPFFFIKFEKNPLDERADSALTVRMRHMEIVYHKGYVEAVYAFLKPPASQLESVEALLNVASQTLEGLRKETRAGLEFALQMHKTIDVHMDMNAPVIIIPENVSTHDCTHLIIDAGHISIESDLADKGAIRTIHLKRNQQYNEEDYKYLESLMYDKVLLKLDAAQFIIGNNLQSCLDALQPGSIDSFHLLERINIDLQVHNSIVPSALSLARFKVSGKLPTLQANFSDVKYKSLLRLIDVCIPKFGNDEEDTKRPPPATRTTSGGFHLASGLFGLPETEYNVDEDGDDGNKDRDEEADTSREELFFEADDGTSGRPELRQHIFELNFQVDNLRAVISKSAANGVEKPLGDVSFERFVLAFALTKFDMKVDINLRSLALDLVQPGMKSPLRFVSSAEAGLPSGQDQDLLIVSYTRVQTDSPEFMSVYEGIDQNVDIKISTFIFRAAPEPIISLYDFIMTTFVPSSPPTADHAMRALEKDGSTVTSTSVAEEKIRVLVKLASVQVILVHDNDSLATLSLSTADVTLLLRPKTLRITGRLGSMALSNDTQDYAIRQEFSQILSIEGQNFAEFRYQTFDPDEEAYDGIKSSIYLNAASVKLHFLQEPLHDIYLFVTKLAKLKGLYDAATQVAVQTASTIERMQFEVSIKTPILVFPSDPAQSPDVLVMRLGEVSARNKSEATVNKVIASLRGIQFVSILHPDGQASVLKIIENIDISTDIIQTSGIDRGVDIDYPDTQVAVKVSDVKLHLTQVQYGLLIQLSQSIPKVLAGPPDGNMQLEPGAATSVEGSALKEGQSLVDLEPELRIAPSATGIGGWTTLDLIVSINAVKLHLYDGGATTDTNVKEHGIARFALNDNTLRFRQLSNGAGEAQVVLRSFTMSNTRPGNSKFREIIPAAQHDRNQFMVLYTMAAGPNPTSLVVLTIDSPQFIFAVDPVIALLRFFTSPFTAPPVPDQSQYLLETEPTEPAAAAKMDYRVDLHDLSVSVLENDMDPESQSIQLSINHILLSQQGIMALSVKRLGMSLTRMGKVSESVRFLDDVDLTLSLDSRSSSLQQMTSIEIAVQPIVFRASYGDISMISSIVNKALMLYGNTEKTEAPQQGVQSLTAKPSERLAKSATSQYRHPTLGNAHVLMSKEQLTGSFDGFRLVLIGDLHEQPMLHLKVKPFIIGARDWSGELQATTTMAVNISYWNLTNSHWEPLIDPWAFTFSIAQDGQSGGTNVTLSARDRLDVNLSTTFAELVTTTLNVIGTEGEQALKKPRGTYAPYRIRNRTGSPIFIWSDMDSSLSTRDVTAVKVLNDQTVDWRFDDWKTMREHVSSSGQHSIGVQFIGKAWEKLRSIPVDREGEYVFSLRPRTKYPSRLLCEVKVIDNVKVVTIRSTYKVENLTLYPLELTLVDDTGHPVYSLEKIAPGHDYSLPIEAVMQNKIRIQPDQGFGYKWCSAIRWEDLVANKSFTIKCPHNDPAEAAFRFQAWVQTDIQDTVSRKLPKLNLKLRAPLELENLLPYNLEYRIYDKDTDQNWRSYLRKGGVMPVHSVELSHFVLLNVNLQDTVFKPSEFAIINTDGQSDFDIEGRLTLQDQRKRKLDLRLNYIRYPESGGAFKVQIYCPYIVINKTGLPFYIKATRSTRAGSQDVAGESQPDVLSTPFPFLLSHAHENGHEYLFKIADSAWSKIVSLEAPAAETALAVASQKQKSDEVHVSLSWSEGLGKYKLTKIITLAPRFLIKNNLPEAISFREHGVAPRDRSVINPGERHPLQILRAGEQKLLTIAYPGLNTQWSPPINMEDIGAVHFRLRIPGDKIQLIRADVQIDGSTIFISFSVAVEWPFVIENESEYVVTLCQKDLDRDEQRVSTKTYPAYSIKPRMSSPYAWDFPAAREKKIVLSINDARRVVDIMEIGNLVPFRFNDNQRAKAVSLDVRADGRKQVLRITNYSQEQSVYKPRKRSNSGSVTRQDTMSSSADAFEAVTENVPPSMSFSVELAGIGISLINKRLVEVIYTTMDTLKIEYSNSTVAQAFNLSCGTLQIDNQLHDALYPVVLQPTPIAKEASGVAALPTVQASVIWLKDQEHGVLFVKYCSVLLQALTIEADEDLLFAIYDLTQINGASWEVGTEDILLQNIDTIPEPVDTAAGQDLYFEVLELQPIKLSLSFMRAERVSSEEKLSLRNPLAVVVNALTMTVGNINDAPLEMNALGIKDMRLTMPELQTRITYHYRQDVLRQLYRILGSADFIGNPVGLFTNVSSGVADIFYEPFHGVVMHGNKELGIGIAKGAASFVKKTVFGLSDSVTKFTSSVGKGLSAATFDSEYQARRRMAQRRNKPRHAIYGVAAGGEALASSVTSAMEGVLMKPIEGAESEGALGFFKGVGKGLVGVVTKPVIGVFDLASNVSEGIRNTTTVFDSPDRDRVRLPRHIPADGVLRPYSAREALGQYWMKDLNNGAYRREPYVAHINSTGDDNVVLLTAHRVLSFWSKNLRLDWELPFTDVQGVTVEDTGIRFAHKAGKENDKFAFIPDKGSQSWFFGQVGSVVKAFNARKRMDG